MRRLLRQAGLERAAEAAADPVAANALRTAWLWLVRMEERRCARREHEARRTLPPTAVACPKPPIQAAMIMRRLLFAGGGTGGLSF